jgi:hypothetical protein
LPSRHSQVTVSPRWTTTLRGLKRLCCNTTERKLAECATAAATLGAAPAARRTAATCAVRMRI